jgi:hypothetical protein
MPVIRKVSPIKKDFQQHNCKSNNTEHITKYSKLYHSHSEDVITCTCLTEDQLLLVGAEEQIYLVEAKAVGVPYLQRVPLLHCPEQPKNLTIPDTAKGKIMALTDI